MTSAFYSSDNFDQCTIPSSQVTSLSELQIDVVYEIQRCVSWISTNHFRKVALQFPDELLVDSAAILFSLQNRLVGVTIFVLADTSYGSCCVDEVAAEHSSSDAIIHYGHSCLSHTLKLPALYVFGHRPIDVEHCFQEFHKLLQDNTIAVILVYDVVYSYAIGALAEQMKKYYARLVVSQLDVPGASSQYEISEQNLSVFHNCGRTFSVPNSTDLDQCKMLYIGNEGLTLTNLMMTYNKCAFYSYDPNSKIGRQETLNINRTLMKRYYMIERAKDAQIVGIVVGTLGVSNYLDIINQLKKVITKSGKKHYLFVMGKLNVAKLANFAEVDIYVLVSCAENALIDSAEFYKPVVTPYEMEVACNEAREWTGDYITDFRQLLPGAAHHYSVDNNVERGMVHDVSLVTGKMRTCGVDNSIQENMSSALLAKNEAVVASQKTAGDILQSRSWKGLEQKLGNTPVIKAVEGSAGIASGYSHETV